MKNNDEIKYLTDFVDFNINKFEIVKDLTCKSIGSEPLDTVRLKKQGNYDGHEIMIMINQILAYLLEKYCNFDLKNTGIGVHLINDDTLKFKIAIVHYNPIHIIETKAYTKSIDFINDMIEKIKEIEK